jgi:hypothetical protein
VVVPNRASGGPRNVDVSKPLDGDVGGLLSLIMFAGINFDDNFFRNTSDSESVST